MTSTSIGRARLSLACLWLAVSLLPSGAWAQDRTEIPGVELGLLYDGGSFQPPFAIKPFEGRFGGQALAGGVEGIIARDLRYSDRFRVMDSIPGSLLGAEGIDYGLWDQLGAVWLLTGRVEGSGDGFVLVLELHDVVFGQISQRGRFDLPEAADDGFRMAVHRASDEIVRWITGEPGMAASRIAFSMRRGDDSATEIWMIDSDGENLTRVTRHGDLAMSPAWSPDATRIAYTSWHETGNGEIYEVELASGRLKKLKADFDGILITPEYHPDGETLAFAVQGGLRSGIYTYDIARECCLANLTESRSIELSPSYSPDGRRIAFNSGRLGMAIPQIYVMPADGGDAELLSPYEFGAEGHYNAPDWSPLGDLVAFHGKIGRFGAYQILVARMGEAGRLLQLTWEGRNEDPSWAPDGRHLVFKGERRWGKGLFVVDTVTGEIRTLMTGVVTEAPQWSPAIPERR